MGDTEESHTISSDELTTTDMEIVDNCSIEATVEIRDYGKEQSNVSVAANIFTKLEIEAQNSHFLLKGRCQLETIALGHCRGPFLIPDDTIALSVTMAHNLHVSKGDKIIMARLFGIPILKEITFSPIMNCEENKEWQKLYLEPLLLVKADVPFHKNNILKLEDSNGHEQSFYITEANDGGSHPFGRIDTEETVIKFNKSITEAKIKDKLEKIGYADIGGLSSSLEQIRNIVELPLLRPEIFEKLGAPYPRGILLFGPPGSGKTNIARALVNEMGIFMQVINGPEIIATLAGESEDNLRKAFEVCAQESPAILFLDEIDAIAPKRDKTQGELEKRIVAQLLTLMDGLTGRNRLIVIGATNRPNSIDPALRRYGRFDKEIHIGIPDIAGRLEILKIHTRKMNLDGDVQLEKIAGECHGYVGADIAALAAEAALHHIEKKKESLDLLKPTPQEFLNSLKVTQEDFEEALKKCNPSALREALVETPNVSWEEIGGMTQVKNELIEMIEFPLKYPNRFASFKMKPSRGVLFYGPPGCGKTMIAKAVAKNCNANFISVKGPELLTTWLGESEANIRDLFARARAAAPCVIFFDELDSLATARGQSDSSGATDRVINQLLTEMDGMDSKKNVFVIGATNRPDCMDTALLRPGRLDQLVYITLPDEESRRAIFKVNLDGFFTDSADIDFLARNTYGYSGADITEICQSAFKHAIRDFIKQNPDKEDVDSLDDRISLTREHLKFAMENTRRSVPESDIRAFDEFARKQERGGSENTFDFPAKEASCSEPVSSNFEETAAEEGDEDDGYD